MQALIKHDTDGSLIWGFVVFQATGWKLIENKVRPHIFMDEITLADIDSLTGGKATELGFELVTVDVEPKK